MYKLVTTAKKSCADPTIVPNGPKPFSKHYSNNNIVFFFFGGGGAVFHQYQSTPLTGTTGRQIN